MTTAFVIAAVVILIAGLFAVIVERTNERDEAREELARRDREDAAPLPRLRIVPEQRDPARDHLAADDAWFAELYDERGELR